MPVGVLYWEANSSIIICNTGKDGHFMSQFEAALFDELEPLYPDTDPREGTDLYITAAPSKAYAGVHIMLSGLTPGKYVTFEVSAPLRKTVSVKNDGTKVEVHEADHRWKLFELLPLPVEANTGGVSRTEWLCRDVNDSVIRRAPFMVYDVLRPCTNVVMARGAVMALCFRCKVDTEVVELKKWEITLSHEGISRRLTFEVEVFPAEVQEAGPLDHKYVNWLSCRGIADYHNAPLFSQGWYDMFEKYLRLGKYGRQNMALLPVELYFDLCDGMPKLNEEKLDRLVDILDRVGIHWVEGGHFACRKDGEWEAVQAEVSMTHGIIPGDGEAELANMCRQLYAYLEKRQLTGRWLQSFMDEPLDGLAEAYTAGSRVIKENMPGVLVLDATIARESIAGGVDCWCPTTNKYEKYQDFFDGQHGKGDHIFVYTCLDPAGNFCNRFLDQERIRQVWIGWAPALYDNVEGYLHWGGMFMNKLDFYRLSVPLPDITDYDADRSTCLPAGDAAGMFPGFHEVYSSTRLEAHRIGFEDLVLLERVKKQDPAWTAELISRVFRRYDDYEKDVAVYRKVRRLLLERASNLS